jgi:hypothetical protein
MGRIKEFIMKAEVIKCRGMDEYYALKISGIKLNSELLRNIDIVMRFPAGQYDWMEDPEAVLIEIARRINV